MKRRSVTRPSEFCFIRLHAPLLTAESAECFPGGATRPSIRFFPPSDPPCDQFSRKSLGLQSVMGLGCGGSAKRTGLCLRPG